MGCNPHSKKSRRRRCGRRREREGAWSSRSRRRHYKRSEVLIPRGKVGTGFSDRERRRLVEKFKPIVTKKPTLPEGESGVTWLRPELVAEVEFAEITRDGSIRQGGFVALREDKPASEDHLDAGELVRSRDDHG